MKRSEGITGTDVASETMRNVDAERVLAWRREATVAAVEALVRGSINDAPPLSRRHRWDLLDLDVRSDRAAVAVARRGKRTGLTIETLCFRRDDGAWVQGEPGPSTDPEEPFLPKRFPADGRQAWTSCSSIGFPAGEHVALWNLVAEAAALRDDGRIRPVPDHGWVVTTQVGRRPTTEVLDTAGDVIGQLRDAVLLTLRHRVRAALERRSGQSHHWFNYSP